LAEINAHPLLYGWSTNSRHEWGSKWGSKYEIRFDERDGSDYYYSCLQPNNETKNVTISLIIGFSGFVTHLICALSFYALSLVFCFSLLPTLFFARDLSKKGMKRESKKNQC
jgi:hypothetical protein